MELIIGIIIASIATLAILYSVLYVQQSSYELKIKERAFEELKSYTNLWQAKIAGNDFPEAGATYNTTSVCLDQDTQGECINSATITSDIVVPSSLVQGSNAQRRGLISNIDWETRNGSSQNLSFYLEQVIIPNYGENQ